MLKPLPKYPRVLGIMPSWNGFGFALVEGLDVLADWGARYAKGDGKNLTSIRKLETLITRYKPDVISTEDASDELVRRRPRIRTLTKQIVRLGEKHNVQVMCLARRKLTKEFFPEGRVTKYDIAQTMAEKYPEELGFRLPAKRKPWQSEDPRMYIFDAVALALVIRRSQK